MWSATLGEFMALVEGAQEAQWIESRMAALSVAVTINANRGKSSSAVTVDQIAGPPPESLFDDAGEVERPPSGLSLRAMADWHMTRDATRELMALLGDDEDES